MQPVLPLGALEVVAREARPVRGAARRAAETVHNLLYTARQRRAPPPLQLWEIPAGEESALLGRCE